MSDRDKRRIVNRQMRRRRREFRTAMTLTSGRAIAWFWEQPIGPPHSLRWARGGR